MGKLFLVFLAGFLAAKGIRYLKFFLLFKKADGENEIPFGMFSVKKYYGHKKGHYLYRVHMENPQKGDFLVKTRKSLHKKVEE